MITWSTYFHFQNFVSKHNSWGNKEDWGSNRRGKQKSSFRAKNASTRDWDPILRESGLNLMVFCFEKPEKNVRKGRRSWNARRRAVMFYFSGPDIFSGLAFRGDGVFGNVKNGIWWYCGFSFTLRFARNSRGKKIWCWRKDALRKRSRPVDFLVPNVNDIGYLFCRVLSWFLAGGFLNSCVRCKNSPQNCRSSGTSDLVRAMDTWCELKRSWWKNALTSFCESSL